METGLFQILVGESAHPSITEGSFDVYSILVNYFGIPVVNAVLLVVVITLIYKQTQAFIKDVELNRKRIDRLERSFLAAQLPLLEMEE